MELNSDITLKIGDNLINLISTVSSTSKDSVLCTLLKLCEEPIAKVRNPTFGLTWSTKKVQYPNTPIVLGVKAKFKYLNRNIKNGDIICTFEVHQSRKREYTEKDLLDKLIEHTLLGASGD